MIFFPPPLIASPIDDLIVSMANGMAEWIQQLSSIFVYIAGASLAIFVIKAWR